MTGLNAEIDAAVPESRYREERDQARAQLRNLTRENAELSRSLDFVQRIEAAHFDPPKWTQGRRSTSKHRAMVCTTFSDWHLGEIVNVDEMMGINKFDRAIAEIRLQEYIRRTIMVSKDYFTNLKYDGMVLFMNGDVFTGEIHEELKETNEGTIFEEIVYWQERLEAMISAFADAFGKLHVVCTCGNHGRLDKKMPAKKMVKRNFEWLVYMQMAKHFKGDKRITWQIPVSDDAIVPVYNTVHLIHHGHEARGGSGIAGALSPLMLMSARKTKVYTAIGNSFDIMVNGHFHQYMSLPGKGLLVNGSGKGYDEYAKRSNFEPEKAQQAFWLVTPEHGITFNAPIIVQDRALEGW